MQFIQQLASVNGEVESNFRKPSSLRFGWSNDFKVYRKSVPILVETFYNQEWPDLSLHKVDECGQTRQHVIQVYWKPSWKLFCGEGPVFSSYCLATVGHCTVQCWKVLVCEKCHMVMKWHGPVHPHLPKGTRVTAPLKPPKEVVRCEQTVQLKGRESWHYMQSAASPAVASLQRRGLTHKCLILLL